MHIETGHWCMDQNLYTDAASYYSRAMQVSDLVASDDHGLYDRFAANTMDQFLDQIRIASIALLEAGSNICAAQTRDVGMAAAALALAFLALQGSWRAVVKQSSPRLRSSLCSSTFAI